MKWLQSSKNSSLEVRVVLVVTSQAICWYRCEDSRITDRLTNSLDDEPQIVISSCLWLKYYFGTTDVGIELVVETELDDLDRVKLLDWTHRVSRSWHIRKVLWQLRREYPDAAVNKLPEFLYPEIASVLYSQLSDQSSVWLKKLCACGVVVSHVVTSTQLLSDLFKNYPSPVLLHMFDGGNRHRLLLAVDGLPLHMRQTVDIGSHRNDSENVVVGSNSFAERYLCESLKYFSESVFSPLNEVLVVFPRELNNAESSEFPDEYLAKHLLELKCNVSYQHISFCNQSDNVTGISPLVSVDRFNKGCLSDILANRAKVSKLRFATLLRFRKNISPYAVIRHSGKFRTILEQSIATMNNRRRARNLKRCTFVVFLFFLFVMLASSRSGILSVQEQTKYRDEHDELERDLHKLKQHAATLHELPVFIMDSINRIHSFEQAKTPAPSLIMSSVATAVQDYPSVSLTSFSWSVNDDESDSSYVAVNSVSIRNDYWGENSSQSKTLVELSGQFIGESSLRQKQSQLNDFLNILSKSESISALRVIDSPAKSASSSHLMSESGGFFKILFSINPI
ncbi:MAG: hypothetical protein ACI9XK_003467 [Granulosicoccus sp.]|jgi:hypothetical protein